MCAKRASTSAGPNDFGLSGIFLQPLGCAQGFDLRSSDNGSTSSVGINARLIAVFGPCESHHLVRSELLQEVLNKGTDRIDATVFGMQPQARLSINRVWFSFEPPILGMRDEFGWKVRLGFFTLTDMTGLFEQV